MFNLLKKVLLILIIFFNVDRVDSTEFFNEHDENFHNASLTYQTCINQPIFFSDFSCVNFDDQFSSSNFLTDNDFLLLDDKNTNINPIEFSESSNIPLLGDRPLSFNVQNPILDTNQNEFPFDLACENSTFKMPCTTLQPDFQKHNLADSSFESCLLDYPVENSSTNSKTKKRITEDFTDSHFLEIIRKRKKFTQEANQISSQNIISTHKGQKRRTKFSKRIHYHLTDGQKNAIADILEDTKSSHSIDRVIIAPVGAGKTEIAMHAALERIIKKQQVVVLAPRCTLVEQHFEKFQERFRNIANVGILKSHYTPSEKNLVFLKIESGEYDIILGTHCLLTDKINYKNLGLVIIDEEQNFGVKDKEFLCAKYPDASTLILTATPIPRTKQLIEEKYYKLTQINNLPQGRLPIIVNQCEIPFDMPKIIEAIQFEKSRQGQIFFITNKIANFTDLESFLMTHCPHITFQLLHGKMKESDKIETLKNFQKGRFDLLLATNIISVGIDIPNANTIIIHNANTFGLSDLYQIKGRVGRNSHQAYAFLLYSKDSSNIGITKVETIKKFSGLNDCFAISKIDQNLRGSGDIFSTKQHGHLNSNSLELLKSESGNSYSELMTSTSVSHAEQLRHQYYTSPPLDYQPYYLSCQEDPVYENDTYKKLFQIFE